MNSGNTKLSTVLFFLVVNIQFSAFALAVETKYDLGETEVLTGMSTSKINTTSGVNYLLTGIPMLNRAANTVSYLAVSPINPGKPESGQPGNNLFPGKGNRPMTWSEAQSSCRNYNALGKVWKLPDSEEVRQLNSYTGFGENVLSSNESNVSITIDYLELQRRLPSQFSFFWVEDESDDEESGLKKAVYFSKAKGGIQRMSMHRLLNVVCVTYLSGPETSQSLKARKSIEELKVAAAQEEKNSRKRIN